MDINALSAAKRIAQLAEQDGVNDLSPLKLQKLLYFTEGGLLAEQEITTFFPETPEAWQYGPVYVDVYEKFKTKENREPIIVSDFEPELETNFGELIENSIKNTWDQYKNKTASELVTLTHRTEPWIIAKNFGLGSRISKEDMREYFATQAHERTTI
jgi:uncharacterized phage-associated protein